MAQNNNQDNQNLINGQRLLDELDQKIEKINNMIKEISQTSDDRQLQFPNGNQEFFFKIINNDMTTRDILISYNEFQNQLNEQFKDTKFNFIKIQKEIKQIKEVIQIRQIINNQGQQPQENNQGDDNQGEILEQAKRRLVLYGSTLLYSFQNILDDNQEFGPQEFGNDMTTGQLNIFIHESINQQLAMLEDININDNLQEEDYTLEQDSVNIAQIFINKYKTQNYNNENNRMFLAAQAQVKIKGGKGEIKKYSENVHDTPYPSLRRELHNDPNSKLLVLPLYKGLLIEIILFAGNNLVANQRRSGQQITEPLADFEYRLQDLQWIQIIDQQNENLEGFENQYNYNQQQAQQSKVNSLLINLQRYLDLAALLDIVNQYFCIPVKNEGENFIQFKQLITDRFITDNQPANINHYDLSDIVKRLNEAQNNIKNYEKEMYTVQCGFVQLRGVRNRAALNH